MAIIDAYSPAGSSSNKAVRSSWASFLVNVSITLCAASKKASTNSEEQAMVLSAVAELLGTCPEDDYETLARYVGDPHTAIMAALHACAAFSRTARVRVRAHHIVALKGAHVPHLALDQKGVPSFIVEADAMQSVCRAFLAAGTIMHSGSGIRSMGRDLGIAVHAEKYKASSNAKVASVAGEVARL